MAKFCTKSSQKYILIKNLRFEFKLKKKKIKCLKKQLYVKIRSLAFSEETIFGSK